MQWIYLIHEFHNLSWITEINELFHDILIYWDAPVNKCMAIQSGEDSHIIHDDVRWSNGTNHSRDIEGWYFIRKRTVATECHSQTYPSWTILSQNISLWFLYCNVFAIVLLINIIHNHITYAHVCTVTVEKEMLILTLFRFQSLLI